MCNLFSNLIGQRNSQCAQPLSTAGSSQSGHHLSLRYSARQKKGGTAQVEVPLDPDARPGLIHVDDAACAFQKAIEKLPLITGTGVYPVFDLVTSQESMRDIFGALSTFWGWNGPAVMKGHGGDPFAKAMSTTFRGSSARAQQLLDWRPTRLGGFVGDMDIYAAAFAAHYGSG